MAEYFPVTEGPNYLPAELLNHPDYELHRVRGEADVISHYSQQVGGQTVVGLRGYQADADDVTDTVFLDRMRETIAQQIEWRLTRDDAGLQPNMEQHLVVYDITVKNWAV